MRAALIVGLTVALVGCTRRNLSTSGTDGGSGGDAATSHDGGSSCSELTDKAACRARPDCVVFTCVECACTPVFVGCGAVGDPAPQCPGLGCSMPVCCHHDLDCQSVGGECQVPPIDQGCGVCFMGPSSCTSDADCGTGEICDTAPCACPNGMDGPPKSCQQGCSTGTPCSEIEVCGADDRCHPRPCDASCTGNYLCDPSSETCVRIPCNLDSDCADYCVDGACSMYVGQCVQPVA